MTQLRLPAQPFIGCSGWLRHQQHRPDADEPDSANVGRMTGPNQACTLSIIMCRSSILGFIVAALVFLMAGALVYEVCDIHDPKPFLIDPEFLLMMLSSILIFCVGIAALICRVSGFCLSLCQGFLSGTFDVSFRTGFQHKSFEIERLLFSPPLTVTSLRI
jgi:hypothetical protein